MAYRYRTNGTAALKPEQPASTHQTPIIDFESLAASAGVVEEPSHLSAAERMAQRIQADPLLGSLDHAFGAHVESTSAQRRTFALAFTATFLLFLGAILLGA